MAAKSARVPRNGARIATMARAMTVAVANRVVAVAGDRSAAATELK